MKLISEIAEENDLYVIEDACQAHGGKINNQHVGTFGEVGCFSFYATKNMISGEGGMVVTNNDELAENIRSLKNHGRGPHGGYEHFIIGYNYRLADPLAAIGLIQLRKLPKMLDKRRKNAESIRKTLSNLDHIESQKIPDGYTHAHYVCAPIIDESAITVDDVIKKLRSKNIASRRIYALSCHKQATYREGIKNWRWSKFIDYPDYSKVHLPITDRISTSHFEIPIHPGVTEEEISKIQEALEEIFSF
jgi:dTDP-4-amino-4,6-dideoxygalactose transaminase